MEDLILKILAVLYGVFLLVCVIVLFIGGVGFIFSVFCSIFNGGRIFDWEKEPDKIEDELEDDEVTINIEFIRKQAEEVEECKPEK